MQAFVQQQRMFFGTKRNGLHRVAQGRRQFLPRAVASVEVDVAQTLQYGKELESAKVAVRLASKLCQVWTSDCTGQAPLETSPRCSSLSTMLVAHRCWSCVHMQIVQRQLSAEERVEKKDDSPVTVADYGKPCCGNPDRHVWKPVLSCRGMSCVHGMHNPRWFTNWAPTWKIMPRVNCTPMDITPALNPHAQAVCILLLLVIRSHCNSCILPSNEEPQCLVPHVMTQGTRPHCVIPLNVM